MLRPLLFQNLTFDGDAVQQIVAGLDLVLEIIR